MLQEAKPFGSNCNRLVYLIPSAEILLSNIVDLCRIWHGKSSQTLLSLQCKVFLGFLILITSCVAVRLSVLHLMFSAHVCQYLLSKLESTHRKN